MHTQTLTALIVGAGAVSAASGQVMVFDNRAAWEAAAGGAVTTETFDGVSPFLFADGQTLDTGNLQVTRDGSANGGDGVLEIEDGGNFGNLDGTNFLSGETGATPHERVNFGFNGQSVVAFGADWFSPFSGDGIGVEINGEVFLLDSISGFDQGFIGFVSTSSFSSASIVGTTDDVSFQELWSADNVSYAVPAPASAALLGLGGLVAARRRR